MGSAPTWGMSRQWRTKHSCQHIPDGGTAINVSGSPTIIGNVIQNNRGTAISTRWNAGDSRQRDRRQRRRHQCFWPAIGRHRTQSDSEQRWDKLRHVSACCGGGAAVHWTCSRADSANKSGAGVQPRPGRVSPNLVGHGERDVCRSRRNDLATDGQRLGNRDQTWKWCSERYCLQYDKTMNTWRSGLT